MIILKRNFANCFVNGRNSELNLSFEGYFKLRIKRLFPYMLLYFI